MTLTATSPDREPLLCAGCGADEFGCAVKLGLGGRPCCQDCSHVQTRKAAPR